jgi:hypothetical protein
LRIERLSGNFEDKCPRVFAHEYPKDGLPEVRYPILTQKSWARFSAARTDHGGCRLPERDLVTPDELLSALKRYLAESDDTEVAVASQIGVNHHTLRRWLSDNQTPKKGKLALAAAFLRHAGYL